MSKMVSITSCPAESMKLVYNELKDDYFVIAPTYNGCHKDSKAFTSRHGESAQVCAYIKGQKITAVKTYTDNPMGCEVGIELAHQIIDNGVAVEYGFFDGAPCASLSKPMRRIMLGIFRLTVRSGQVETVLSELKENKSHTIVTMVNNLKGYEHWEDIVGKGRIFLSFSEQVEA